MDIKSLKKAYEKSPDNGAVLAMLLKALDDAGEQKEAREILNNSECDFTEAEESRTAAEIFLKTGDPEQALDYCDDADAESLIIKAKAYLALLKHKDGLDTYTKAVKLNPALEDPTLEKSLKANVKEINIAGKGNVLGFKVLSSENQSQAEQEPVNFEAAKYMQPKHSLLKFKDVGGLDEVKKQIHRKIILPFQKPSLFEKFKKRAGGGVLMYGPPGCGKTMLARATAGECGANFYNIAISDVLDMWIGESEKKLSAIFEQARRTAPSVIFFDELEALAGKRNYGTDTASSKMVSQFLTEMDGFSHNNQGVLILGATNVPWSIDAAFRRPGRFDRVQFVPPPDKTAREVILKLLMEERPVDGKIDYDFLAKFTSSFSGADLSNLVETACDIAIETTIIEGKEQSISMELLKEALREIKPTTTEWLTTARNYAKYSNEGGQYDEVIEFLDKHGK